MSWTTILHEQKNYCEHENKVWNTMCPTRIIIFCEINNISHNLLLLSWQNDGMVLMWTRCITEFTVSMMPCTSTQENWLWNVYTYS